MGSHYESSGGVVTKYYLAGGTRLAMRKGSDFYWLLSDHLGSTSKVATAAGALHSQQLYKAWGETRYTSGTLPTRYTYTGQYSYAGDFGLVFYGSRFYDPLLSRWASPDSIIPQNQGTLAWDRYSYVNNSPLNYTDPTGHWLDDGCSTEGCSGDSSAIIINPPKKDDTPQYLPSPNEDKPTGTRANPSFDATLGGNNSLSEPAQESQDTRPSVDVLLAIGIPLTIAIILVETGLTFAEIQLGLATLAAPELTPVALPLEFILTGTSLALLDIEIAYWSYTIRVASTPESEPVKFDLLPPWGFGQ